MNELKFFDTHCHLDMLAPVKEAGNARTILADAQAAGVDRLVCVGVELPQVPDILELTAEFDWVRCTAGLHPLHKAETEPTAAEITEMAAHERIVAVGETGLDYHYKSVDPAVQRDRLRKHVRAARELAKPVIIHTREAGEDTLSILQEERADECGGVIHCFTESLDFAKEALELGFYISFSGIVTFRTAENLREVARHVPLERILIETDAPYLAPVPNRGKENQPAWVSEVAASLARERNEDLATVARVTRENGLRFFGMQ